MRKSVLSSCLIFSMLFIACQEEPKRNDSKGTNKDSSVEKKEESKKKERKVVKAPISSPEKMFNFIHKSGVEYVKELMNNTANSKMYVAPQEKALNLGIYTTDLAYSAAYQDIESSVELYKVVKRLGAELDIAEMMTSEMVEEMQANMENPDSLAVVAGHAYYQAVVFFRGQQAS